MSSQLLQESKFQIVDVAKELKPGEVWSYYVDGFGRYMGTVKFHLYPNCRYLVHHKPARGESDCILMTSQDVSVRTAWNTCKVCKKRFEGEK